jgi:superfamily I DNA/RNA helicase
VIHGAAGSGKTMILICRAQQLAQAARPDAPVLVLCFNRALADRIAAQLRARGVEEHVVVVRTFHAWCQDVVKSYQLAVPADARDERWFEALADTVARALDTGFVPSGQYTALLVDEAHDFDEAWLRMAVRLVNPATKSVLVLYDDAQSIYQPRRRKFSFASVGIEARGRTSILRMNYRNTAEVLAVAMHVAQSLLRARGEAAEPAELAVGDDSIPLVQPQSAGRRGPLPVLIEARDAAEEARLVAERVAAALAGGRRPDEIAVLLRAKYLMRPFEAALAKHGVPLQSMNATAFRRFDWNRPAVRLVTLHSAKGLEFPLVFVAGLQALPMRDEAAEEAVRLLYVAMTRATHELVLSASGESAFVQRVRAALAAATAQFAAEGTESVEGAGGAGGAGGA